MSVLSQSTLKNKINLSGVGIHNGKNVNVSLLPGPPNSGIIFKRVDLNNNNIVIPNFENVCDATLCTTISNQFGTKVSTIEHLMAAFLGLGVDNAVVEIDSQEVPILDGSAKNFVEIIKHTGLKNSDIPIKLIKINNLVELEEDGKYISLDKSNTTLEIEFEINYKNEFIKTQKNKINVFEENLEDIFNSRTFCLYEDIEKLKKIGLGKGGYRLIGSLKCAHGGHSLTNKLLRKVFSDTKNYSLIEIKGKNLPHSLLNNRNYLKSIA